MGRRGIDEGWHMRFGGRGEAGLHDGQDIALGDHVVGPRGLDGVRAQAAFAQQLGRCRADAVVHLKVLWTAALRGLRTRAGPCQATPHHQYDFHDEEN